MIWTMDMIQLIINHHLCVRGHCGLQWYLTDLIELETSAYDKKLAILY